MKQSLYFCLFLFHVCALPCSEYIEPFIAFKYTLSFDYGHNSILLRRVSGIPERCKVVRKARAPFIFCQQRIWPLDTYIQKESQRKRAVRKSLHLLLLCLSKLNCNFCFSPKCTQNMSHRNQKFSPWAAATWKKKIIKQTKEGPFAHSFSTRCFHFSLQRYYGAGQEEKTKASEQWICSQTIACWHHWHCVSWGEGNNSTIPDNQQLDQHCGLVWKEKTLQ